MKTSFLFTILIIICYNGYSQNLNKVTIEAYKSIELEGTERTGQIILNNQGDPFSISVLFDDIDKVDTFWVRENENLFTVITPEFRDDNKYKFSLQLKSNIDRIDLLLGYNDKTINYTINRILLPSIPEIFQSDQSIYSGNYPNILKISNVKNIRSIDKYDDQEFETLHEINGNIIQYKYKVFYETNEIEFTIISLTDGNFSPIPLPVKIINSNEKFTLVTLDLNVKTADSQPINLDENVFYYKTNISQSTSFQITGQITNKLIGSKIADDWLVVGSEYFIKDNNNELVATLKINRKLQNIQDDGRIINADLGTIKVYKGNVSVWYNDQKLFLTDLEIKPNPIISKVEILRKNEWTEILSVRPNERFLLRISGQNLINSRINFNSSSIDCKEEIGNTNNFAYYNISVLNNIQSQDVTMIINENFEYSFKVVENQIACPLDYFTSINDKNFKEEEKGYHYLDDNFSTYNENLYLDFNPALIDNENSIFGIQFLQIEINIYDIDNNILGKPIVDKFFIIPTEGPRVDKYSEPDSDIYKKASGSAINIKDLLPSDSDLHMLNNYRPWETIEIIISTDEDFYKTKKYTKKIMMVNKQTIVVKPKLTIPTGLFIYREGGLTDATGISTAALYQLHYYKGNKYKLPINWALGFIALDAFNFVTNNDNPDNKSTQDLGVVSMVNIEPSANSKRKNNMHFVIHLGGGYLFNNKKWFWLIGPGISISMAD